MERDDILTLREGGDHPAVIELDRFMAGELTGEAGDRIRAHLDECESCAARYERLLAQRDAFFEAHPELEPTGVTAEPLGQRLLRWIAAPWIAPAALTATFAGLLLLYMLPTLVPGPGGGSGDGLAVERGHQAGEAGQRVRLKAGFGVSFDVMTEAGQVEPGVPGGMYRPGDRIQLRYTSPHRAYVLVVSLDSRGGVTVFYDHEGHSMAIEPGVGRPLPGSILLDDAQGPERVFACFSEGPLPTDVVLTGLAEALREAKGDPVAVEPPEELPCKVLDFLIFKSGAGREP